MSKSSAKLKRYHYYDDEDLSEFIKQETIFWCKKLSITQSELFEASEHELQKILIALRQRELLDDIQTADYIYGDRLVCKKTLDSEFCRVTGGCDNDDESLLRILRRFAGELSQTFNATKLQSALERSSDMDFDEDCSETSDIEEDFYGGGSILNSTFNAGAGACGPNATFNATFDAGPGACGGNATFDASPGACGGNATFNASPGGCGANATFNASPGGCGANATFDAGPGGCGANATFDAGPGGCGANATFDAGPGGCGLNATYDAGPGGCGPNATFDAGPGGCGLNATYDAGPGGCGPNATFDVSAGGCGGNATFDAGPGGCGGNATFDAGPGGCAGNATFDAGPGGCGGNATFDVGPGGCGPNATFDVGPGGGGPNATFDVGPGGCGPNATYNAGPPPRSAYRTPLFQYRPPQVQCPPGCQPIPGYDPYVEDIFYTSNNDLKMSWANVETDYVPEVKSPTGGGSPFRPNPFMCSTPGEYRFQRRYQFGDRTKPGAEEFQDPMNDTLLDPFNDASRDYCPNFQHSAEEDYEIDQYFLKKWKNEQGGKQCPGNNSSRSSGNCSANTSSSSSSCNRTQSLSGGNATFNASSCSSNTSSGRGNRTFNKSARSGCGSPCGGNATFNASTRSGSGSQCAGNATFNASTRSGSGSQCGGNATFNASSRSGGCSPCGGNATFNASPSSSKYGGGRTPNFANLPGLSSPYDSIANTSPPELQRSPCDSLDNTSPPPFYHTPYDSMQNTSSPFCGTPQTSRPSTRHFCDTTPAGRGSNASMKSFQQFRQNRQCSGGGSPINCERPLSVPAQQYIQHCLDRPSAKPPIGDVVFRPPPDGCVPCWGKDNDTRNKDCCCSCPPGFPKICPRVQGVDYEESFLKKDGDDNI